MSMSANSTTGQNVARTLVTAAAAGFGAWLLYRFWRLPFAPRSVRPGINDPFSASSPQPASDFVGRFETESREIFNLCPRVVQALQIKPGQRVADLGAGTGLFLEPLAKAVSTGSDSSAAASGHVVDTYHHLEYPSIILRDAWSKLKKGGRLAVLDFERIPGVSSEWVLGHVRAGREVVLQEIEEAGFKLQSNLKAEVGLKENYLMLFVKE